MLYGCTSWPWVYHKAFIGTRADLMTAKLFHPCPGDVAWHVTNPLAGAITSSTEDHSVFVPDVSFYGHSFVVGVHADVRCVIPFWVTPDHSPLYSPALTFRIYSSIAAVLAPNGSIYPRAGSRTLASVTYPTFTSAFHPSIKFSATAAQTPLHDYFGYLWIQDGYFTSATYKTRTDFPFAAEVQRTITLTGTSGTAPVDISATVTGGTLACRFHLLQKASDLFSGVTTGKWVRINAADGEQGSSILTATDLSASFRLTRPGTYGILAVDDWDNFLFDLAHTPTVT